MSNLSLVSSSLTELCSWGEQSVLFDLADLVKSL
jgi:hypothetical protein